MKTKYLAYDAMLSAMCAVLGYISLEFGAFKFTFESFPILLAAMMLGPVHGAIVALVGTFIYQVLKWGLMSTTVLWIIPYIVLALFIGLLYKEGMDRPKYFVLMISGGVILTLLNTLSIYIDSKIWDYYTAAYVFGTLPIKLAVSIAKSIVFALALPLIIDAVKKAGLLS